MSQGNDRQRVGMIILMVNDGICADVSFIVSINLAHREEEEGRVVGEWQVRRTLMASVCMPDTTMRVLVPCCDSLIVYHGQWNSMAPPLLCSTLFHFFMDVLLSILLFCSVYLSICKQLAFDT